MALTRKRRAFVEAYLRTFNASASAREAGYSERTAHSQGPRLLENADVQAAIRARLEELTLAADEVLARLAAHARGDIGHFFRVVEAWTEHPLPTQEPVLDEDGRWVSRTEVDGDGIETRLYRVRQVALDTAKLVDPRYSPLVKKLTDSPRSGLSLELYDAQSALVQLGKGHRLFVEGASGSADDPIHSVTYTVEEFRAEQARRRQQAEETMATFAGDDDDESADE